MPAFPAQPESPEPHALPLDPPLLTPAAKQRERLLTLCLLSLLCLLYLPFAGSYGLWDPWETHYGEVGRQMAARNDWISLWWPGSPQDPASGVFFSKPVLTFWLMALSLKAFGLGHDGAQYAHEMTVGWRAEWALRMPFILLGILGVWATYYLVRRIVGRRAALWSALVLATSTQWALITRQAMTDMAFVAPMTLAVVFAALALLPQRRDPDDPDSPLDDLRAELPRAQRRIGPFQLSWPKAPAFYLFLVLYVGLVVPQLTVDLIQLQSFPIVVLGRTYRVFGAVAILPFVLLFLGTLWWCSEARNRRAIYLWIAYLMGAVATLAKGPAGIGLPLISLAVFLVVTGRLGELLGERRPEGAPAWARRLPEPLRELFEHEGGLELLRGALIFFCTAAPWFVSMLARHGMPFWNELIGDNYVHRAQGRHGDRGTFEYYLRQLGAGLFPWSGVVAAAGLLLARWLRRGEARTEPRRQLVALCACWFFVDFIVVTLVNTKFHHYILPALPPLAVLAGLLLDDITAGGAPEAVSREGLLGSRAALLLVGLPVTFLSGRDLAAFPARIGWLFNYDYVNVPGTGRPWPVTVIYGTRYEYGDQVLCFVLAATVVTALLVALIRREPPPAPAASPTAAPRPVLLLVTLASAIALAVLAGRIAPSPDQVAAYSTSKLPPETVLPRFMRLGFLVPAGAASLWLLGTLIYWRKVLRLPSLRRAGALVAAALLGVVSLTWICWVLDRYLIDISPHWSQKHVFATYYRMRQSADEPVVAWMMYWRGENLYTCNQIYDHRLPPGEKTVFLGDRNTEKLQEYLRAHRGRHVFFLIERHRLETLRGVLPAEARSSLEIVDDSNNKVYLARAQL
jgi:4-amino-4-deoxy-L-arabinose transferase-like glycosyltransferase